MGMIQVTATELKAKAGELEELNGQLKTKVEALNNHEVELGTMWEGEAKNAFDTSFRRDKEQMDNFIKAINQYVETLRTIAAKYEQAEAQNTEIATARTY